MGATCLIAALLLILVNSAGAQDRGSVQSFQA